jgi:hypothetical protein
VGEVSELVAERQVVGDEGQECGGEMLHDVGM